MIDDDLLAAVRRTHDDLLAIARMFGEEEHYMTALHIQGFATRLVVEAISIAEHRKNAAEKS